MIYSYDAEPPLRKNLQIGQIAIHRTATKKFDKIGAITSIETKVNGKLYTRINNIDIEYSQIRICHKAI